MQRLGTKCIQKCTFDRILHNFVYLQVRVNFLSPLNFLATIKTMTRNYLITYLATVECYPDNTGNVSTVSQLWRNDINGLTTFVPFDDPICLRTYCRIFYELRVPPPNEHGFDSDYAVFSSFMD